MADAPLDRPLDREQIDARLDQAGAAGVPDIAGTALLLAALDRPQTAPARYHHHLDTLIHEAGVAAAGAGGIADCAAALAQVIGGTFGYVGDAETYDDMRNANLMHVIDRRRGLPVALGIIYAHVARAQGWGLVGLNFPGHFLVRLDALGGRAILDPFGGGTTLDPAALRALAKRMGGAEAELDPFFYEPVSDRDVLLRLQNNIKLRALQAEDFARAADVARAMLRLAPTSAPLWHELGAFEAQQGKLGDAIAALESCLAVCEDERQRQQVRATLQKIRGSLN
jgi:regulator of sirC expression with transglutaminase-like and TPR domain